MASQGISELQWNQSRFITLFTRACHQNPPLIQIIPVPMLESYFPKVHVDIALFISISAMWSLPVTFTD